MNTWRCPLGKCLRNDQVCNGVPNCRDGSDETTSCSLQQPQTMTTVPTMTNSTILEGQQLKLTQQKSHIVHTLLTEDTTQRPACYTRDPGSVFFREDVQTLLQRLIDQDYEKLFRNRKLGKKLETPKLQLLTDEELNRLMTETEIKVKHKLKMPPLMKERDDSTKVLSRNPELQGFDKTKYVFTDISMGVSERERVVVVRDPDGVLREASWEEKQRVCQIYFPVFGRQIRMPKMFEDEYLQDCLSRGEYEFILDRACIQFEPDDPGYIRVTRKTYECVDKNGHYDALRSTRHFGPMVLHLTLLKRIDNLLFHLISREEIEAGADLVRLFHLVENTSSSLPKDVDSRQVVENHALKKPALELAWETYLEIVKQRAETISGVAQLS
nr:EOG090X0AW0 [Ilyocryptus agilis]